MTNNFGGGAVGFRHAAYLAPAMLTLLLPLLAGNRAVARAVLVLGGVSAIALFLFTVRQPWTSLTLDAVSIAPWPEYLPIVAKLVSGNVFNP